MRKLLCIPFILMFMLSCEPEEITKLLTEYVHDTVIVEKYIDRVFTGTDTVKIPVTIHDTDTVFSLRIDSIFVYRTLTDTVYINTSDTVYIYDTVVVHHYGDTLVKFESEKDIENYGEWLDIVIEFHRLAREYGWEQGINGNAIVELWPEEDAPPASRSSYTYYVYGQLIFRIKSTLTHDESLTPLFREFARKALGKKYDHEGSGTIMDPSFDPKKLRFSDSDAKKKPYYDVLFSHEPI